MAKALAAAPKSNASRPRTVIITQGPHSTIMAQSDSDGAPKVYPVTPLKDEDIVDTNGAGDAFAGGFLGAYVLGKDLDVAIEAGHKMGSMCVQQVRLRDVLSRCVRVSDISCRSGPNLNGRRFRSSRSSPLFVGFNSRPRRYRSKTGKTVSMCSSTLCVMTMYPYNNISHPEVIWDGA